MKLTDAVCELKFVQEFTTELSNSWSVLYNVYTLKLDI